MIHVAIMPLKAPDEDGAEEWVFCSLTGDDWLQFKRRPTPKDEEAIAAVFEGDGNFTPMTFGRRAMDRWWWNIECGEFDHYTIGRNV